MRGRRLASALVAGALLVAVVAVVAARDAGTAVAGGARVDGYPQRIGFERPSPALPQRPGPLAATLFDNDFGTSRPLGVTSRGRLYELPYGPNVLSPDGRLLLTGQGDWSDSRIAVHDLSTGEVHVFEDIGQTIFGTERGEVTHKIDSNGAVLWSPDGSAVLARFAGDGPGGRPRTRLLDVSSGALTDVSGGAPAGFLTAAEVVTVGEVVEDGVTTGMVATTTDVVSGATSSLPLRLDGPWRGAADSSVEASVSPEGTLLLVEAEKGRRPDATLRLFSLADGTELAPRSIRGWDGCSPGWLGDDPVLPTTTRGFRGSLAAGEALVTAEGTRPLVAVHHRMQSSCLQLSAAALRAGPHRSLLGTSTALWTWYWWQLLLATSLALLGIALVARRWRRRGTTRAETPWS